MKQMPLTGLPEANYWNHISLFPCIIIFTELHFRNHALGFN